MRKKPRNGSLDRLLLSAALTLLTLLPAPLLATTMGFARQLDLPPSAGPSLHWISLPWSYQPQELMCIRTHVDDLDNSSLCSEP